MDRNTIIGFVLIALVLIGYSIWTAPSDEQIAAQRRYNDSIALVQKNRAADSLGMLQQAQAGKTLSDTLTALTDSAKNAALQEQYGAFSAAVNGTEKKFTVENDLLRLTISNKGGKIVQVQLKNYTTWDKKPLLLYDADSSAFGLNFFAENRQISTNNLFFEPVTQSLKVSGNDKKTFSMRLNAGNNRFVQYDYTLTDNKYDLGFNVKISNLNDLVARNATHLELDWHALLAKQEATMKAERAVSSILFRLTDESVTEMGFSDDAQKETPNEKIKWVAFKQQFFSSVLIADKTFDDPIMETETDPSDSSNVRFMKVNMRIPFEHKSEENFSSRFYFGPNHYQTLKKYDLQMEKLVPLGWGIFGWVNRFLVIPVFNWLNGFNLSFGIIILVLTIIIKVVLLPLTYKSYMSGAKMRVLQPEMKEIQDKHKDDPMKSQQELLSLYRKAGVNPLGGCLPMLLQFPILIAMLRFFPASIELRQESFLWATDLSTYDSIWDFGYVPVINFIYGDHVSLFTLLMTISTLFYTHFNMQMTAQSQPGMKYMMYLMPLMFMGFLNSFAAGLNYYYFLANIISIGQTFLFRSFVDEKAIHAKIQENKKKAPNQKKSGFQERLEKMAKERGYKAPKK